MLYRCWSQARINEPFILLCLGGYTYFQYTKKTAFYGQSDSLCLIKMLLYIRTENYVYFFFVQWHVCTFVRETSFYGHSDSFCTQQYKSTIGQSQYQGSILLPSRPDHQQTISIMDTNSGQSTFSALEALYLYKKFMLGQHCNSTKNNFHHIKNCFPLYVSTVDSRSRFADWCPIGLSLLSNGG